MLTLLGLGKHVPWEIHIMIHASRSKTEPEPEITSQRQERSRVIPWFCECQVRKRCEMRILPCLNDLTRLTCAYVRVYSSRLFNTSSRSATVLVRNLPLQPKHHVCRTRVIIRNRHFRCALSSPLPCIDPGARELPVRINSVTCVQHSSIGQKVP